MGFDIVLGPGKSVDADMNVLAWGGSAREISARLHLNVEAPTDDSPFFFHQLRLDDIFRREVWGGKAVQGFMTPNIKAVAVLGMLTLVVVFLTIVCLIVPLIFRTS